MAEYSKYSKVSPQWLEFESKYPALQGLDKAGVIQRRQIFDQIEADVPPRQTPTDVREESVRVKQFTIIARDGHQIPLRSYIPTATTAATAAATSSAKSRPLVVYLHAGGFLFGDLNSGELNCRVLATRLDVTVLNVGYRLAPQCKFPAGLNDCYDAVAWAAANAESQLEASLNAGFVVGGISSGANLAAVVAYQARDAGLSPPITALWISIPVGLMPQAYDDVLAEWRDQLRSLDQNAVNPLLTKTSLSQIADLYGAPTSDPRISFLLNESHQGLPKRVYFQVCGQDPLRDEAFLWQKLLHKHSGTQSMIHMYSGLPHGFLRFLALPVSQGWLDDLVEGIAYAVGNGRNKLQLTNGKAVGQAEEVEGGLLIVKGL